eukprot:TRINITY_DN95539_c0_g1_i1.p2 TRINITY_DN95539_c0_g1~~TRINITY_DN95539_c0_g1_i1.p2  ORF type:complete len:117 (-),score=14.87 TRINITY_DN95539_c0_g1_i1:376-726(-)
MVALRLIAAIIVAAFVAPLPVCAVRLAENSSNVEDWGLRTQCCVRSGFDVPFSDATYQQRAETVAKHLAYTGAYHGSKDNSFSPVMWNHFDKGLRVPKDKMPHMDDMNINAHSVVL